MRWARMEVHGDATSLVADRQDRIYVFTLSAHPVIAYDRDGCFLDSWGEGIFTHTRGGPSWYAVRVSMPTSPPIFDGSLVGRFPCVEQARGPLAFRSGTIYSLQN